MTRQLTSQHTDGLFGSRRRGAPLDRVIRIVIVSLANFVTFVWFVRRSRRASFADEVEEERGREFRSPPRSSRTLEAEDARRVVHVVAKRGTLNGTEVDCFAAD